MFLDTEPLTLEHPDVRAAKRKWDEAGKITPRRHSLTFEQLFEYFKADCVRQNAIADEAHITRERIRVIYNKFFRNLFEGKTGKQRIEACTLEQLQVRLLQAEQVLFEDKYIKKLVEKVRQAGCSVKAIPKASIPQQVYSDALFINGHACAIHTTQAARQASLRSKRKYGQASLAFSSIKGRDIFIFCTMVEGYPERIFIFPVTVVCAACPAIVSKGYIRVYIPLEHLPVYNNMRSKLDWWQYENAWHLLAPKQYPAPT